jgi:hypothetical protein
MGEAYTTRLSMGIVIWDDGGFIASIFSAAPLEISTVLQFGSENSLGMKTVPP